MVIFLDGQYVNYSPEALNKLSPGVVAGKGAFETLTFIDGKMLFWKEHVLRLKRALRLMKITPPQKVEKYLLQIKTLIKRQKLSASRIRLMIWKENGKTRDCIVAQKLITPSKKKYQSGFKLCVSSLRRNVGKYTHVKSIDYQLFHEAHREALKNGFDEALLLNRKNQVVEAAYSNVFAIRGGVIFTPPISAGCLEGITRSAVISLARKSGFKCVVKSLSPAFLTKSQEVFLTNSIIGIMPVKAITPKVFNRTAQQNITQQLAEIYDRHLKRF